MPSYHPDAEKELRHLGTAGSRNIKRALGLMIKRHHNIDNGSEPLSAAERLPSSGPSLQHMYRVPYTSNLADLYVVYEVTTTGVRALATEAWDRFISVALPGYAGDAIARAWSRAS